MGSDHTDQSDNDDDIDALKRSSTAVGAREVVFALSMIAFALVGGWCVYSAFGVLLR